ncbi:MAG TPA: hypothetical protein VER33_02100 [Polyangiaceae bacterium]|nr:hypothetical protein [Polyangiaceae bacterium]
MQAAALLLFAGRVACGGVLSCVAACGSNRPELPPGLGAPESCVAVDYPLGPYGTEPGSVVQNACFQGLRTPSRVATEAALEAMALSDYYDPDGTRGVRLLLVNTAALWCSACRIEHETLPASARALSPRGLVVVSALFEDSNRNPAEFDDLSVWVESFDTNFPIVLDPSYSFGLYASAETAPLNLVVDPRNMTILKKVIGDQPAVLWPFVEAELSRRGAP